ncbi:MAG: efflux RND transporter periplasmic adaptor subunit [Bacteroidales bacterium]
MGNSKRGYTSIRLAGVLFLSLIFTYCNKGQVQQGLPEYAVMTIDTTSTTVNNSFPASIRGSQDIEIHSNVDGFIVKVNVDEGAIVKKGELLFEIDHSIYEADYNMAKANLEVAKAQKQAAKLTADNKTELAQKGIISNYEKQLSDNTLVSREAELAQAEAKLKSAKTNLDYSYVKSPSDGIVGSIPFRIGSLVGRTTQTPLTTVSKIENMFVYFSMNEKQILDYARKGGNNNILKNIPEVELKLADGTIYQHKGKIETISGVLDLNTGAANMRATFKNPEKLLRSGSTGIILIPNKSNKAMLIPQTATFEMQDKKFVCLLNDSNIVKTQEIKVAALSDGQTYIITEGLKPGDRIVTEGVGMSVKDGMQITPITKETVNAKLNAITTSEKKENKK